MEEEGQTRSSINRTRKRQPAFIGPMMRVKTSNPYHYGKAGQRARQWEDSKMTHSRETRMNKDKAQLFFYFGAQLTRHVRA